MSTLRTEKWLSVAEIAAKLKCSKPTVYKMLKAGLVSKIEKKADRKPRRVIRLSDAKAFQNLGVRDELY